MRTFNNILGDLYEYDLTSNERSVFLALLECFCQVGLQMSRECKGHKFVAEYPNGLEIKPGAHWCDGVSVEIPLWIFTKRLGINRQSVYRITKRLEQKKVISISRHKGHENKYFVLPGGRVKNDPGVKNDPPLTLYKESKTKNNKSVCGENSPLPLDTHTQILEEFFNKFSNLDKYYSCGNCEEFINYCISQGLLVNSEQKNDWVWLCFYREGEFMHVRDILHRDGYNTECKTDFERWLMQYNGKKSVLLFDAVTELNNNVSYARRHRGNDLLQTLKKFVEKLESNKQ